MMICYRGLNFRLPSDVTDARKKYVFKVFELKLDEVH